VCAEELILVVDVVVVLVALLRPYDVVHTAPGTFVTEFFFTRESFRSLEYHSVCQIQSILKTINLLEYFFVVALLPAGPLLLSPVPVWYSP
jgi:hypothetical protein